MLYQSRKHAWEVALVISISLAAIVACDFLRLVFAKPISIPYVILYAIVVLLGLFCCIYTWRKLKSYVTYAKFDADGIRIKRQNGMELCFIPWDAVLKCEYRNTCYAVIIVHPEGFSLSEKGMIKQYRLDDAMEALAAGKMTKEEFLALPMLCVDDGSKKIQAIYAEWRKKQARARLEMMNKPEVLE